MLLELFDRGQAAIQTLERIRDLLDEALVPKPVARTRRSALPWRA